MATTLRYRLFKVGRMPPSLAQAASGPDVVVAAEGISLRVRGSGLKLPGRRAGRSVSLHSGAIVLTPRRLLASNGRWLIVDSDLHGSDQPHRVQFAADGVHLFPDLPALFGDSGSGELEFHWSVELDPVKLASLPSGPASVELPQQVAQVIRNAAG